MSHRFEDGFCLNCAGAEEDTLQGMIGCDAEEVNDPAYFGLALTRREQVFELTALDKIQFIFATIPNMSISLEDFRMRVAVWNEMLDEMESIATL